MSKKDKWFKYELLYALWWFIILMISMLCLCFYHFWLCPFLTNPLRYLMFGNIVLIHGTFVLTHILSTFLSNVGCWEDWLTLKGRVSNAFKMWWLLSPHSIWRHHRMLSFMFFTMFSLLWVVTQKICTRVLIDGF